MSAFPPSPQPVESSAESTPVREEASASGALDVTKSIGLGPRFILNCILGLLVLIALDVARDVFMPITIALMFNLLLSPVVLKLKRIHIPEALGAALLVGALVLGVGWGIFALSSPATEWIHKAPDSLAQIERKVRSLKKPVQEVSQATKQIEKIAQVGPPGNAPPTVAVRDNSLTRTLLSGTSLAFAQIIVVVVLLYFLLAAGDTFMRRFVKALSHDRDRRRAIEIVSAVQHDISLYLGTVTIINLGLGGATAAATAVIGLPNPVLWGVVAATLNFIPYVGALITTVILAVVGLLSFESVGHGLLAPVVFQVFSNIESNFVTPYILGRNLTLSPALVFIAVVLWGWMWGVPGAFLAVPFLVLLKIFADHIEALRGLRIFLGRGEVS